MIYVVMRDFGHEDGAKAISVHKTEKGALARISELEKHGTPQWCLWIDDFHELED